MAGNDHTQSPYRAQACTPDERQLRKDGGHPCTHCAHAANEQACLNAWADEQFGGRLELPRLAARVGREAAYLTELALAREDTLVIDQIALMVVLAYRVADTLGVDLWQQVTTTIGELQGMPDHEEPF